MKKIQLMALAVLLAAGASMACDGATCRDEAPARPETPAVVVPAAPVIACMDSNCRDESQVKGTEIACEGDQCRDESALEGKQLACDSDNCNLTDEGLEGKRVADGCGGDSCFEDSEGTVKA